MSSNSSKRYDQRGVSATKDEVHKAIQNIDKGLFPKAFCKIVPDYLTGSEDHCIVMHADGAGTKSSLAYAYWKETGDLTVWKGIAQDALVMNIDDLICVGAKGPFLLSSTIGRNKNLIPGEVISSIINGTEELIEEFKNSQNSVLIGSFSFWEGIDLIGDNLTLLIIDKLPFKSPDDPIVDAKINLLNEKDFFMKSQIPMTTLLMKQGLGRLIRNFSDKGVAILGDNRIQKKYYGKQILKSLPPFQLVEDYNQVLNFIEELR